MAALVFTGAAFFCPLDTGTDTTDSGHTEIPPYCDGNDQALANCDPDRNYDPWIAHDVICDDTNKQKSDKTFQFDVARRRSMVDCLIG